VRGQYRLLPQLYYGTVQQLRMQRVHVAGVVHRIKQLELVTFVLEDMPQRIIQELVISAYGTMSLSAVTMSASAFAVLFNLLQWVF